MRLLFLAILLAGCSSKAPAPEPEILPCHRAKTFKEFVKLDAEHAKHRDRPLVVAGKKYACVESALEVEPQCYVAKTKKEFNKLSREQEKRPAWPVKVDKKYYRCIQEQQTR